MGRFLLTLAVAVWLGTVVSFSYVLLPAIHAWAPDGGARDLLRRLFPRYHAVGLVCGVLALAAVAVAAPSAAFGAHERVLLGAPVAVALLCAMIGRQVMVPRLAAVAGAEGDALQRAHGVAAMLNTTVLALLVLALAAAL